MQPLNARRKNEFAAFEKMIEEKDKIDSITTNPDNWNIWKVVINGPPGTPYEGGKFTIQLTFPPEFPFKCPEADFQSNIYHINIDNSK
jgi:ubiquitin-protein ligase